jgi:hypothetical protein
MRTSFAISAFAALLGIASVANAGQTIASSAIFAGTAQNKARCIVRNTSSVPMQVTVQIFNESGQAIAGGSCGTVTPGHNCSAFANIANGVAHACSASTTGSAKALRGSLVIYDEVDLNDLEGLRSAQLR